MEVVFFDIDIQGHNAGRMIMEVYLFIYLFLFLILWRYTDTRTHIRGTQTHTHIRGTQTHTHIRGTQTHTHTYSYVVTKYICMYV